MKNDDDSVTFILDDSGNGNYGLTMQCAITGSAIGITFSKKHLNEMIYALGGVPKSRAVQLEQRIKELESKLEAQEKEYKDLILNKLI